MHASVNLDILGVPGFSSFGRFRVMSPIGATVGKFEII